jgi:hypothetical protein
VLPQPLARFETYADRASTPEILYDIRVCNTRVRLCWLAGWLRGNGSVCFVVATRSRARGVCNGELCRLHVWMWCWVRLGADWEQQEEACQGECFPVWMDDRMGGLLADVAGFGSAMKGGRRVACVSIHSGNARSRSLRRVPRHLKVRLPERSTQLEQPPLRYPLLLVRQLLTC